jgi:hypothetical protein
VVAWRIEHVKKLARTQPQAPCSVAFDDHEWQAVFALQRPNQPLPSTPPSVREITRLTAELGGFLGRKSDGEPGSITPHVACSAFMILSPESYLSKNFILHNNPLCHRPALFPAGGITGNDKRVRGRGDRMEE